MHGRMNERQAFGNIHHLQTPTRIPQTTLILKQRSSNMIRTALFQSVKCAPRVAARSQPSTPRIVPRCLFIPSTTYRPANLPQGIREYSAPAGLAKPEVEGRIMDLLKGFDKVTEAAKVQQLPLEKDV
ncbi:MAG: hypothetical protein Q9174_000766 [Haloplaca sp. 1 TL-2023]